MKRPARPKLTLRKRGGFTLVEVLVAVAVLAFSLSVLMGTQSLVTQQLKLADQMYLAAILIHEQMLRIEDEIRQEGASETTDRDCGDFDEDQYEGFEWCVEIEPVEISDDAEDQFVANVHGELFGEGASGEGSLSGSAAVSRFLPMIIGQVPQFINQVGERTRKITLTIEWEGPFGEQSLTVTQYFVLENSGSGVGLDSAIPTELQQLNQQMNPAVLPN